MTDDALRLLSALGEGEGKGYFLSRNADEIERHYRGEYSRAMAILVRTKGERKFLKKAGRL